MRKSLFLALVVILLIGAVAIFLTRDKGIIEEFKFMDCPDCDQPALDRKVPW